MNAVAYWQKRSAARMDTYLRDSRQTTGIVSGAYRKTEQYIIREVERIRKTYLKSFDLSEDEVEALLSKPCGRAEYERLLAEIAKIGDPVMRRRMEARASSGAYAYRVSRLEALLDNVRAQVLALASVELDAVTAGLTKAIRDGFMRSMYDIQRGVGVGFSFSRMNPRVIEAILKNPWSGKTFSTRIWKDADRLTSLLNETLASGFMSGKSNAKIAQDIAERMGVSYRNAERLVRTEVNYMAGQGELESYRESGIEQYQYLATLDDRTSEVCADLDLQIFYVKDAVVGKNMHPMHPHCRSTTVAWIDEKARAGMERRARDPATGKNMRVPRDMPYREWEKRYAK